MVPYITLNHSIQANANRSIKGWETQSVYHDILYLLDEYLHKPYWDQVTGTQTYRLLPGPLQLKQLCLKLLLHDQITWIY